MGVGNCFETNYSWNGTLSDCMSVRLRIRKKKTLLEDDREMKETYSSLTYISLKQNKFIGKLIKRTVNILESLLSSSYIIQHKFSFLRSYNNNQNLYNKTKKNSCWRFIAISGTPQSRLQFHKSASSLPFSFSALLFAPLLPWSTTCH